MIASMTGFARQEATGPWGALVCELRSVNHRFLEIGFRLPDVLRGLEGDFRRLAQGSLKRGKVDGTFSIRAGAAGEAAIDIDPQALERVIAAVGPLASRLGGAASVNVLDVLRWPGVLRDSGGDARNEALLDTARTVFQQALADLSVARLREGERLREHIEQRCRALSGFVAAVQGRAPEVRARAQTKLQERLAELGATVDSSRIEQELAMLLQRLDTDEELDRLSGHLEETRRIIASNEPAGRRLDFLMQELNREANTLSSKSQDLETTRIAVEMKVAIEQMREQVQNIE